MSSKSIPIEPRELADRTVASLAGWRLKRMRAALHGPLAIVATGATFPVAQLWARLHEASGMPAWALTPTDCLHREMPADTKALFLSASGRHHDMLYAAHRMRQIYAVVCDGSAPLCDLVRGSGGDAIVLPPAPQSSMPGLADPRAQIPLITLAAAMYDASAGISGLACPLPELPDRRPRHVLALGAGLAQPAAADFAARCRESGFATARVTDLRNVAHGELMAIQPGEVWMIYFSMASEDGYVDGYCAALPPELARIIVRPLATGPAGAIALMHMSGRLATAAMTRFETQPTVKDLPAWMRALYRLAR
ncbi:MAG: hypothetical protein ACI9U2_000261 [Bradymonadia bacterium]